MCRPNDLTDPAPATTFAHLDATIVLERSIAELGIYPAVDPRSHRIPRALTPDIVGQEHYDVARGVQRRPPTLQGPAGHYRDSGHGRTFAGRQTGGLPRRKIQRFLSQPFSVGGSVHRRSGKQVPWPRRSKVLRKFWMANTTTCLKPTFT